MPLLSHPAFGPRAALAYITVGALLDVWTAAWYFWFARDQAGIISRNTWFWLTGLFLTGVILMLIGFYLGRIGRAARKAEMPPPEVEAEEAAIQHKAASVPHPITPGMVPAGGVPGTAPVTGTTPGMMAAGGGVTTAPPAPPAGAPAAGGQYVPGVTRR